MVLMGPGPVPRSPGPLAPRTQAHHTNTGFQAGRGDHVWEGVAVSKKPTTTKKHPHHLLELTGFDSDDAGLLPEKI